MKKVFILGAMVFALGMMAACKSGQQEGNVPKEYLSVADFSSDELIVMGTYDELIAKMGEPEHYSDSGCVAKRNGTSVYIPLMQYPGISYIRKSDSVQLFFVDFRMSGTKLSLRIGNEKPLTVDSNTVCDDFYAYMDKFVFADGNSSTLPDEERMAYDVHYMTDGLYYALGFPCDTIDKRYGNVIRPVFTPSDKRLWYMEFGAVDMDGLYRNKQ